MSELSVNVSVIIVVHNSLPTLRECLVALAGSSASDTLELICVDNASADNSSGVVREYFPGAVVIRNDRNLGFAAACNRGAAQAHGSHVLFLNPDVIVDRDAIASLVGVCEADMRAGLVSGRLRNPDGTFQSTCRRLPTFGNLLFSRGSFLSRFVAGTEGSQSRYTLPDNTDLTEVPAVAGTMVMIRKAVFDQVGGFDERFFMYMEDTDLSLRLSRAGYHNLFAPQAGGIHYWGVGSSLGRAGRIWHHHQSLWKYFRKHRPGLMSVLVLPFLLGGNLLLSLLARGRRAGR